MAYTTINKSTDYFNTKLYTGTATSAGNTQAITGVGFQPDWVWIKNRGGAYQHVLYDAVRGVNKEVRSSQNIAEVDSGANGYLSGFDSDGFTTNAGTNEGNHVNNTGDNFVSWNWKANGTGSANTDGTISSTVSANTTAGFSIVSYTGTGANATVGHGLGANMDFAIFKLRSGANSWLVYHKSLGATKAIYLNETGAVGTNSSGFNNTEPTSSVFSLGSGATANTSGGTQIAYCFAEKKGYSKFGSYTGNGNADGTFVYTGFKPAFVIIKQTNTTGDWMVLDNKRDSDNGVRHQIYANTSGAESVEGSDRLDFLSNGIKHRSTGSRANGSGGTYIFMAFAENPFVTSTGVPATAR